MVGDTASSKYCRGTKRTKLIGLNGFIKYKRSEGFWYQ